MPTRLPPVSSAEVVRLIRGTRRPRYSARPSAWLPLGLAILGLLAAAPRAVAVMIDEIQVYTDDINKPGKFGVELHVNSTLEGRSAPEYAGEITPQHGLRVTPEFSYGLTPTLEAGLYLPTERTSNGALDFAGPKIRLKWLPVQPDEKLGGAFAGANVELSWLQRRFEEGRWSTELRTIVGWRSPDWLVAANPVFGWTLAGPDRSGRPEFDLQLKASRRIAEGISFGPEYYAGLGPLGSSPGWAEQDHSLYAAFDIDRGKWVFNAGIGRGVSHAADRWTVKFIFELPF